ncbi:MAG: 2-oxoacid:acceptor oxidoreductase family protein [Acidobacteriaceae bacterium]|nr:2-oxoacid:acceptor oxidoreductase family protein [Acidobacteriaceae bacterium]
MFQIRIHGRGGQGVVTAAEILSIAAFLKGKYAQAFPAFGSERMGAPVTAFCRIDDRRIRLREPIVEPDALIIQDATLLHRVPLFDGLADSAYVLINSTRSFPELALNEIAKPLLPERCWTLPATKLGLEHVGRPIPNAALLGGFAAMTGVLSIDSVASAIMNKFSGSVGEKNVAAARAAYGLVMERNVAHAEAS